jgi:hypothetical protein
MLSMCKGGVATASFASERMTVSWLNAQVPVSRMASERMVAHFISGPRVHTYNATTVLLSVFEGKGPRYSHALAVEIWRSHCDNGVTAAISWGPLQRCAGLTMA